MIFVPAWQSDAFLNNWQVSMEWHTNENARTITLEA